MQLPYHFDGEAAFAVEYVSHPVARTNDCFEIFSGQPLLLHAETDGLHGSGGSIG